MTICFGRALNSFAFCFLSFIQFSGYKPEVGTDYGEGTPVPIPNTEVKLICAEDTWLVTAWNNRWRQHKYSSLAQLVEHAAVNRRVVGSSPTRGAKGRTAERQSFLLFSILGENRALRKRAGDTFLARGPQGEPNTRSQR